jgi:aminoglycoside phosphotransferase (APT) family kinase protein
MALSGARKYSERLGVIDCEQLQRACRRFDLGSVERAEPATAGLWGQTILLTTTTGEFVLRGNPTVEHQFRKERAVAAAIHDRTSLAVPWPYLLDDDTDLFGWSYAVMPLLPGSSGAALWDSADDEGRLALAAAHGEALARLHEGTFAAPGPYDPARDRFVPCNDYRSWTMERIGLLRSLCRSADALSIEDERFIDALLESSAAALDDPFVPVLVHHDFSLANTTYAHSGNGYEPVGVFDLGEAHIGDGNEDLIRFLFRRRGEQRQAFVEAYRRTARAPTGAGDRLAIYALADVLFLWNVSARVTNWFGDATFVDVASPVISNARTTISH